MLLSNNYAAVPLHILTCEVGLKIAPNVELSFWAEIKGKKKTITVTVSAWPLTLIVR